MNIKGINLYGKAKLYSEEERLMIEREYLAWKIADDLRQPFIKDIDFSERIAFEVVYDEQIKKIKECLKNIIKRLLEFSLLSEEKRKSLEKQLASLEENFGLVTYDISFDKKMNPIDCLVLRVSKKKVEVVSKIIKPIKEKIISVTDLLIIGNSRVLRI